MSDSPENNRPASYEVGYGKPPKHTQFKKGCRPPNPKGRPRKLSGSSVAPAAGKAASENGSGFSLCLDIAADQAIVHVR
jgi:hypothetical protein